MDRRVAKAETVTAARAAQHIWCMHAHACARFAEPLGGHLMVRRFARDAHACARFAELLVHRLIVRRSREIFAEIDISSFSNLRLTSMVNHSRHAGAGRARVRPCASER